jgi:hypothetical protein
VKALRKRKRLRERKIKGDYRTGLKAKMQGKREKGKRKG